MIDLSFVTQRLATGGALIVTPADVAALQADGIAGVIDCREVPDAALGSGRIACLFNPTLDDGQKKPVAWFKASIDFALSILGKSGGKVYAHCQGGLNRGPSTALAILLAQGLGFDDALGLIKRARPQATVRYAQDALAAVKALGYQ